MSKFGFLDDAFKLSKYTKDSFINNKVTKLQKMFTSKRMGKKMAYKMGGIPKFKNPNITKNSIKSLGNIGGVNQRASYVGNMLNNFRGKNNVVNNNIISKIPTRFSSKSNSIQNLSKTIGGLDVRANYTNNLLEKNL